MCACVCARACVGGDAPTLTLVGIRAVTRKARHDVSTCGEGHGVSVRTTERAGGFRPYPQAGTPQKPEGQGAGFRRVRTLGGAGRPPGHVGRVCPKSRRVKSRLSESPVRSQGEQWDSPKDHGTAPEEEARPGSATMNTEPAHGREPRTGSWRSEEPRALSRLPRPPPPRASGGHPRGTGGATAEASEAPRLCFPAGPPPVLERTLRKF